MKVKLGQAVKMFFGNSSLEMVYFEAIANSLDAQATEIKIEIQARAYNQPESISIKISDNGVGFTDDRYKKFSNLFDVEESSHKGLGRLVYLCYFDEVKVTSFFGGTKKRHFDFTEGFKEEDVIVEDVPAQKSDTTLYMTGYTLTRLRSGTFIQSAYLKSRILQEFYSRLFQLKQQSAEINIEIISTVDNKTTTDLLTNSDIPKFEIIEFDSPLDLFEKFYLYFSINEVEPLETSLIAAVSVDNRTIKVDLIADENKPIGYNMVFLLYSDWFRGKADNTRQSLNVSDSELQNIQTIFRKKVAELIESRIPKVKERNIETQKNLVNRFPHLSGYFHSESIGYISRTEVLKKAQDQFFKAQKDLLEASSLSDEQYDKSLELSARALIEYILFRQFTIDKLKKTSRKESESELHNLFATMKSRFNKENLMNDLYRNNAWLLDDKYMTYETVLSDKELGELIQYITEDEVIERDDDRPDLALVFSNNPSETPNFDLVIVELKKRGISLEENMKTVTQLEKRARKLMKYYSNKIQRIWYYGIVEFNEELELHLSGEYKELYSSGKIYYKDSTIAISKNPDIRLPIGIYMWDIDAVISDADSRNSAFLRLIKSKFTSEE